MLDDEVTRGTRRDTHSRRAARQSDDSAHAYAREKAK